MLLYYIGGRHLHLKSMLKLYLYGDSSASVDVAELVAGGLGHLLRHDGCDEDLVGDDVGRPVTSPGQRPVLALG